VQKLCRPSTCYGDARHVVSSVWRWPSSPSGSDLCNVLGNKAVLVGDVLGIGSRKALLGARQTDETKSNQ